MTAKELLFLCAVGLGIWVFSISVSVIVMLNQQGVFQ